MAHTILQWLSRYTNITLYSVDFYGVADYNLFGIISMVTSPSSAGSKIQCDRYYSTDQQCTNDGYRINCNCTSIIIIVANVHCTYHIGQMASNGEIEDWYGDECKVDPQIVANDRCN